MQIIEIHNLSEYERKLIDVARIARKNAVAPISNYQVGSAVLTVNGKIFPGANIEDAAFNSTVHAEVSAISAANASGDRNIRTLALCTNGNNPGKFPLPCLHCWQFICNYAEVLGEEIKIISVYSDGEKCAIGSTGNDLPNFLEWGSIGVDVDKWKK